MVKKVKKQVDLLNPQVPLSKSHRILRGSSSRPLNKEYTEDRRTTRGCRAGRATTLRSPRRRGGDLAFLHGYKKPAGHTNCCAQAYLALQLQEPCFATPFEHGPRLRGGVLQNAHGTPTVGIRHQRVALVLVLEVLLGVHVRKPLDEHQSRERTSKRIWSF